MFDFIEELLEAFTEGMEYPNSADDQKFIKIIKRIGKIGFILIVALVLFFNSIYFIQEQEKAVVTTMGVPTLVSEAGMHFKIPYVQKVQKVSTIIYGMQIGYDANNEFIESESLMITSDYNFVNVDFYLEYQITDPIQKLYASDKPASILKNLAISYIRDTVGLHTVDEVITTGKGQIQSEIKEKLAARIIEENLGLQLINITIQDAQPPNQSVSNAFTEVETAKQGKDAAINNANSYRNTEIPKARGEADSVIRKAESDKEARINEAKAQVSVFNAMYAEYRKNPEITRKRMFYETMESILPRLRIYIDDGTGVNKLLPIGSLSSFGEGK